MDAWLSSLNDTWLYPNETLDSGEWEWLFNDTIDGETIFDVTYQIFGGGGEGDTDDSASPILSTSGTITLVAILLALVVIALFAWRFMKDRQVKGYGVLNNTD